MADDTFAQKKYDAQGVGMTGVLPCPPKAAGRIQVGLIANRSLVSRVRNYFAL